MFGVAGVFGGSLFSAMHGSLVTSSLISETNEFESVTLVFNFKRTSKIGMIETNLEENDGKSKKIKDRTKLLVASGILISIVALSIGFKLGWWSMFIKKASGFKALSAADLDADLPILKPPVKIIEIPDSYFKRVGLKTITFSEKHVSLVHCLNQPSSPQLTQVTTDSIVESVSADYVQRHFFDEVVWYY